MLRNKEAGTPLLQPFYYYSNPSLPTCQCLCGMGKVGLEAGGILVVVEAGGIGVVLGYNPCSP